MGTGTPEGTIKRRIKDVLAGYGERVYYFMPVPSGYGTTTVDFLICFCGVFIAVEAKRPGHPSPTALQGAVLERVRAAGGRSFIVHDTKSLQSFETILQNISKERAP
jgi:hypothetical protein